MRQTAFIYARGNMIINTLKFCTDEANCNLYKTDIQTFTLLKYGVTTLSGLS